MTLRQLARALVPPLVTQTIQKLNGRRPKPAFRGWYSSFAEARAAEPTIADYETLPIIEATIKRTQELRSARAASPEWLQDDWSMQNLAAIRQGLGANRRDPLRVLDFGGGMGLHYFALRPFLGEPGIESWTVCETSATARAGNASFAEGPLRFISDLTEFAGSCDLVLTSGALQYLEDPTATLTRLAALSDILILNRVPFQAVGDRVAFQTTDGSFYAATYPVWFFEEQTWLRRITDAGFNVKLRWWARADTIQLDDGVVVYQGLLAIRDRASGR